MNNLFPVTHFTLCTIGCASCSSRGTLVSFTGVGGSESSVRPSCGFWEESRDYIAASPSKFQKSLRAATPTAESSLESFATFRCISALFLLRNRSDQVFLGGCLRRYNVDTAAPTEWNGVPTTSSISTRESRENSTRHNPFVDGESFCEE